MSRQVLVIGGMPDAGYVVEELLALGYPVAWVWQGDLPANGDRRSLATYPYSMLLAITGFVGEFRLRIRSPEERTLVAGCVVVATGNERISPMVNDQLRHPRIITTEQMAERLTAPCSAASITSNQRQHVLFALDLTSLSGKEAVSETLHLALRTRLSWSCEVTVLYRELQVDSPLLESLTRRMRETGIVFHRLISAMPSADSTGVSIEHADGSVRGRFMVIPPLVRPRADNARLAELLQITMGSDGYFQQMNVRSYRTGLSNRKGIFLAGRCHLDTDSDGARGDACIAAANVDVLLGSGQLAAETVVAHVDSAKCVRCLTCIRTCPHVAVELADYEDVTAARVSELACFGCGACAANCPARAINMQGVDEPAWMQEVVAG